MATKTMNFTSKGIIGEIELAMENAINSSWVDSVSPLLDSNETTEHYSRFGAVPRMRAKGESGHLASRPREITWSITNADYEASIDIPLRWIKDDKTGQIMKRINQLGNAPTDHWVEVLSTLIEAGTSTTITEDGQYFFDTDHSLGDSGTLSNDITTDISALPCTVHGSTTVPSVEEAKMAIHKSIRTLFALKDDKARPINQGARQFDVLVPLPFWEAFQEANMVSVMPNGGENALMRMSVDGASLAIAVFPNPWLTWTEAFATFVRGGDALIRQEQEAPFPKAKAEGSDYEYDNEAWQFAVQARRGWGYGLWQHAVLNTLV